MKVRDIYETSASLGQGLNKEFRPPNLNNYRILPMDFHLEASNVLISSATFLPNSYRTHNKLC